MASVERDSDLVLEEYRNGNIVRVRISLDVRTAEYLAERCLGFIQHRRDQAAASLDRLVTLYDAKKP